MKSFTHLDELNQYAAQKSNTGGDKESTENVDKFPFATASEGKQRQGATTGKMFGPATLV